jgi:hypothetical protein
VLPNFLVIGAMKGGTTSLYEYLRRHPQVFMSDVKELHYFAPQINWIKGQDWYEEQFSAADGAIAVGEASTSYTKYPDVAGVPERIARLLPGVRLIYVVRHPVERIRSQYLHQLLMGEERKPFEMAVRQESRYVDYSRYFFQIERYLEWFDRSQILVITSEALRGRRGETLRRVFSFLGIDELWVDPSVEREFHRTSEKEVARPGLRRLYGSATYQRVSTRIPESVKDVFRPATRWSIGDDRAVLTPRLRGWLEDAVRDDVDALKRLLGPDFDGWGIA